MNYKLTPSECQSAFEELYRSSPVPIAVRSACNSSLVGTNKSVFRSPQPLCHTQLVSPKPLVTSTSGPKLDPKAFESLKNTSEAKRKTDVLVNGITSEKSPQDETMTDGGEGDSADDCHRKYAKGKGTTHIQPDTSTADTRLDQGDAAKASPAQEEEDDEDDHFINNFFSKKAPKDIDSVSQSQNENQDGEETCQDADMEDISEASSQDDEIHPRKQRQTRRGGAGGREAPIKLYDWIVKPIMKTDNIRGVCLDGKKDKSIDEYWQTGVVTSRQTATILETSSGSCYHLIGYMDVYEAVEAGMSPEVAKKFKRGFPVNWIHVLEEFFSSVDKEESSTVEEDATQAIQRKGSTRHKSTSNKRGRDQYYLDSADSEEETRLEQKQQVQPVRRNARSCDTRNKYVNKSSSSSNSQREESCEDIYKQSDGAGDSRTTIHDSRKEKRGSVFSSTQEELSADDNAGNGSEEKKVTKLHLWIIKPMKAQTKGICLEGQRDHEDEYWHSSVITKRLDQKRVVTNSGSVYQLVGPIQKLDALEAGVPEKIVKAFQNGFPNNWKTLLRRYYDPGGSVSESEISEATTTNSMANRKQNKRKIRTKRRKPEPVMENIDLDNTYCTPHGQLVDLEHLPKTRSGRRVMPQLAWWVGQRRSYDSRGNVMEITYGTPHAESYVKKTYTELKTRSFPHQRYTVQNTSKVSARKDKSNVESEVLSVIDKQKQDRLSQSKEGKQETCYNKNSKADRRKSKLDMIPIVPLTVMKSKAGQNSDCEDEVQNSRDKDEVQNSRDKDEVQNSRDKVRSSKTSSKKIILDNDSSSSEEAEVAVSKRPKRQTVKAKKIEPPKKRKSAESSSESEVATKKPRRTRRIVESDDETSANQAEQEKVKPSTRNDQKNKTKSKKSSSIPEINEWGKSEIKRLNKAIEKTSEHHPQFWDVIAESVETRSADECRIFHEKLANSTQNQEKNKKNKPKGKSKKGKSKKDNLEDDLFQATPFRPSNNKKSKTFNLTADETVAFEEECMPTPGALHKTPIVRDIQSLRLEKSLLYKSRLEKQTTSAEESEPQNKQPPKKKNAKTKSKTDTNEIEGLTAGKGTLKRKEQLRDIYNKHNEGGEDDIFQATPLRESKQKKKVPQMFTLTEEEELEFESGCIPTPGSRHKTPIVRDSQSSRFNKLPNSTAKTVTTPWLSTLNRKTTDQVIAQNQRQGGRQNKNKDIKGSRTPRATGAVKKSGPNKSLFKNDATLANLFEEVDAEEDDDEEEKDYYWSDEEN